MENTISVRVHKAFLEKAIKKLSEQITPLQQELYRFTEELNQIEKDLDPLGYKRGWGDAAAGRSATETGRAYVLGYQYGRTFRLPIS